MQNNIYAFRFRLVTIFFAAIFLLNCKGNGGNVGSYAVTDPSTQTSSDYQLVWSDEFDGASHSSNGGNGDFTVASTGLNLDKWNIETGYGPNNDGWGNNESQLYTNSSDNIRVENGSLVITARCNDGVCGVRDGSVTSARITTKDNFEFRYGKVEARIKVPAGRSAWPAFWMLGSSFPETAWPASGEIDIMEVFQGTGESINTTHSTLHWQDDSTGNHTYQGEKHTLDAPLSDDFHTWTLEWDETRINAKIDDISYYTKTLDSSSMREFLKSYFLILNVAVNGNLGGEPEAIITTPQEMLVDWVRVYQKSVPTSASLGDSTGGSTLAYSEIVTSGQQGGNTVVVNTQSQDVEPLEDDDVVKMDFMDNRVSSAGLIQASSTATAAAYDSGAAFKFVSADLSCFSHISVSLNNISMPGINDLRLEIVDAKNMQLAANANIGTASVQLANYTPSTNGNWRTYQIPLSAFMGVDMDDVVYLGFWNPMDASNNLLAGTLYFDAINFSGASANCYGGDGGNVGVVALPVDFEDTSLTYTWTDFDGGDVEVVANPQPSGINTSATVAQMVKDGGRIWGGSSLALDTAIDFTLGEAFKMKVWAARSVPVLLKLEGSDANAEVTVPHSGGSAWEELSFDFTGNTSSLGEVKKVTVIFDNGVLGDHSNNPNDWLFYFDDVTQSSGGGGGAAEPTDAPATPTASASEVISLYSDVYTDVGSNMTPGWGEVVTDETHANNAVKKTTNFLPFALTSPIDITSKTALHVDVWLAELPGSGAGLLVKLLDTENGGPHEGNYTYPMGNLAAGQWNSIEIPLSSFVQVNGTWDAAAQGRVNQVLVDIVDDAVMFVDNIYFYRADSPEPETLGVYSETHTTNWIGHTILSSSEQEWGSNPVAFDASSSAVTAADGSTSLEVDWQLPFTATWGGVVLDFVAATDVSSYTNLVLSVNTSEMVGFGDMHVKLEDSTGLVSGHQIAYLSNHVTGATTSGDWTTYTIPLSAFPNPNKTILKNVGLWSPVSGTTVDIQDLSGKIYFDNIHFAQ
jgi:beta-glucanase (GH16 family)